jgi:hypothetical protein
LAPRWWEWPGDRIDKAMNELNDFASCKAGAERVGFVQVN